MFSKYSARKWNKVQKKEMQGKFLTFYFSNFLIFYFSNFLIFLISKCDLGTHVTA
jgi:hypothetical protein